MDPSCDSKRPQTSQAGWILWLAALLSLATAHEVLGQTSTSSLERMLRPLQVSPTEDGAIGPGYELDDRWTLEQPIDPKSYQIVPGDKVSLAIWGESQTLHRLGVTPEGQLIVPKVGTFPLLGLTLAESEAKVASGVNRLYPRSEVTLRLLEPGRFRITVSGMVSQPGTYVATGADRLSMAITAAGGVRPGGSIRRIRVHRASSDHELARSNGVDAMPPAVDLLPWMARGEVGGNLVLTPGVVIEVPSATGVVQVHGAINGRTGLQVRPEAESIRTDRPEEDPVYEVEQLPGDTLGFLLDAVGGESIWSAGTAVLYRNGSPPRRLSLRDETALGESLIPGDRWEIEHADRWVYVVGEVRLPGRYPFYPGMSLFDYVQLAGGVTSVGRSSGWEITLDGARLEGEDSLALARPGMAVRIPETRTQKVTKYLAPVTTAAALVLSVIALTR